MIQSAVENLNFLFTTVWGPNNPPRSNEEVATSIQKGTKTYPGVPINETDLHKFREGDKGALTETELAAIANFFGLPRNYFEDEAIASGVNAELKLLARLRQAGISSSELNNLLTQIPNSDIKPASDELVNIIIELHNQTSPKRRNISS